MRYADDSVVGFESKADAERFLEALQGAVGASSVWR